MGRVKKIVVGAFVLAVVFAGFFGVLGYQAIEGRGRFCAVKVRPDYDGFSDLNPVQLAAARSTGLANPVDERGAFADLLSAGELETVDGDPLVNLRDMPSLRRSVALAHMTDSAPWVTPAAAALIRDVGEEFRSRLRALDLPGYRIVITSGLRSRSDQESLRARNVNATTHSAHFYGTTFDISYSTFRSDSWFSHQMNRVARRVVAAIGKGDWMWCQRRALKEVLAQSLEVARNQGKAHVKHENQTSCFHVTVR